MSQEQITNIPSRFCNSLIATPESAHDTITMVTTALKYIANTRPLHDSFNETDAEDYNNGKQLILEHLTNMVNYACDLAYVENHKSHSKVKTLESSINDYKELTALQSIVNNPQDYYQNYLDTNNLKHSDKYRKSFDSTYITPKKVKLAELKARLKINDECKWQENIEAYS